LFIRCNLARRGCVRVGFAGCVSLHLACGAFARYQGAHKRTLAIIITLITLITLIAVTVITVIAIIFSFITIITTIIPVL